MIQLQQITKTFGARIVLRNLNLTIHEGDFITLMGANGVGKTTLLHLVASLSKPTAGNIIINGYNLAQNAQELRRFIGLVSHKTLLYDDLTADQNLQFYAKLYNVTQATARIETLLQQVGLWGRQHDPVRVYSRGMQQRLSIARALLHNPPILLLDEPDTGLDQQAAAKLSNLLLEVSGQQRTILMTTHNFEWGVSKGNRVVMLARGQVVYDVATAQVSAETIRAEYQRYMS